MSTLGAIIQNSQKYKIERIERTKYAANIIEDQLLPN